MQACTDWDTDCLIDLHGNDDALNTTSDEVDELPSLECCPATLPSSRESMVDTIDTVDVLDSLGQMIVRMRNLPEGAILPSHPLPESQWRMMMWMTCATLLMFAIGFLY